MVHDLRMPASRCTAGQMHACLVGVDQLSAAPGESAQIQMPKRAEPSLRNCPPGAGVGFPWRMPHHYCTYMLIVTHADGHVVF